MCADASPEHPPAFRMWGEKNFYLSGITKSDSDLLYQPPPPLSLSLSPSLSLLLSPSLSLGSRRLSVFASLDPPLARKDDQEDVTVVQSFRRLKAQ